MWESRLLCDLVEDESLADVAPVTDGTEVVDKHQEQKHKGYAGKCINGIDEEHHDQAAKNAQGAGMPCKTTKWRSKLKTTKDNDLFNHDRAN